jgi:hypothetical protein
MITRLLATLANIHVPRTLQCPNCGWWYQEGTGHGC